MTEVGSDEAWLEWRAQDRNASRTARRQVASASEAAEATRIRQQVAVPCDSGRLVVLIVGLLTAGKEARGDRSALGSEGREQMKAYHDIFDE